MANRAERAFEDVDDEDTDLEDDEEWGFDDEDPEDDEEYDLTPPLTPDASVQLLDAARQDTAPGWLLADGTIRMPAGEMTCRVCGCSDNRGCPGGCLWAAPNLCSRCVA